MIFSPMTSLSSSFSRKRNLPTPPPSLSDVHDSSSCSSTTSSSYSTPSQSDTTNPVPPCDLVNLLSDQRFRPVFQAINELKRRKCRPDLERILKYVGKRSTRKNPSDQRQQILSILDELLKYGVLTKVFHKGGFTLRIRNENYAKLIENMNLCYHPTTSVIETHKRETPSPEFGEYPTGLLNVDQIRANNDVLLEKSPMTKEIQLTTTRKRSRSQASSSTTRTKKTRLVETVAEQVFRKPLVTHNNLPPVTIEQLLGLRGDIPDVHQWTTNDLMGFFHQQGYEYAAIVLSTHGINGEKLYELKREQVFHLSTLKIGKALKLWNVIEQIQRNNLSS